MLCRAGMFEVRSLPLAKVLPIAAAYVAYIVLGNLSLNVNSVSFYQAGYSDFVITLSLYLSLSRQLWLRQGRDKHHASSVASVLHHHALLSFSVFLLGSSHISLRLCFCFCLCLASAHRPGQDP